MSAQGHGHGLFRRQRAIVGKTHAVYRVRFQHHVVHAAVPGDLSQGEGMVTRVAVHKPYAGAGFHIVGMSKAQYVEEKITGGLHIRHHQNQMTQTIITGDKVDLVG